MKKWFHLILFFVAIVTVSQAQLKAKPPCGPFYVDILNGTVDNAKPDFNAEQIKEQFPCYTSLDSAGAKCGTLVSFKDRDLFFYIDRKYVEIKSSFKGKLSIPLLGAARGSLFKWLGNPKLKDTDWDAFQMQYGTLVLHYNTAGKVIKIQFSTKSTDDLSLCE